ncbi:MAG: hypothetical protein MRQ09_03460 [Candidatus Midichloria sp.]|nr:hypothetical protein [Candidatus Midichloria sp.]
MVTQLFKTISDNFFKTYLKLELIIVAFVYQKFFFQHRDCDITSIGVIDEKGGISNQPIDKFNLYSKT